jgi:hypothetical protein
VEMAKTYTAKAIAARRSIKQQVTIMKQQC